MLHTHTANNNNNKSTLFTSFRRCQKAQYANPSPFSRYTQPRHTNQAECMKFKCFLGELSAQKPLCGWLKTLQGQISPWISGSGRRMRRDWRELPHSGTNSKTVALFTSQRTTTASELMCLTNKIGHTDLNT